MGHFPWLYYITRGYQISWSNQTEFVVFFCWMTPWYNWMVFFLGFCPKKNWPMIWPSSYRPDDLHHTHWIGWELGIFTGLSPIFRWNSHQQNVWLNLLNGPFIDGLPIKNGDFRWCSQQNQWWRQQIGDGHKVRVSIRKAWEQLPHALSMHKHVRDRRCLCCVGGWHGGWLLWKFID